MRSTVRRLLDTFRATRAAPQTAEQRRHRKRFEAARDTERLLAEIHETDEAMRAKRYEESRRIVERDIERFGWYWPSDHSGGEW
jgi:hypothetical protein